jgi:hypothetical protein
VPTACRCGSRARKALACLACGAPCCRACAFEGESAIYCGRCAESIPDAAGLPLNLVAAIDSWSERDRHAVEDRLGWVIVVARDRPDLLAYLARAFAGDRKIEIVMDRRRDHSRNPPAVRERLRARGAAALRRPHPSLLRGAIRRPPVTIR